MRLANTSKQFVDMPSPIAPTVPSSISNISFQSAYLKILAIDFLSSPLLSFFFGEFILLAKIIFVQRSCRMLQYWLASTKKEVEKAKFCALETWLPQPKQILILSYQYIYIYIYKSRSRSEWWFSMKRTQICHKVSCGVVKERHSF